ncbi:MAG: ABC-2 family transporter protein [Filifactoraceae bacterium]
MKYTEIVKKEICKGKSFWKTYVLNSVFILMNTIIQILIYSVFFQSSGDDELWKKTVIYLLMASIVGMTSSLYRIPEFSECIYDGSFIKYSVRPIKYWVQFFLMEVGASILSVMLVIPVIILIVGFLFVNAIKIQIVKFVISLILAIILSILMTNSIYSLTQITLKNSAPRALLQGVAGLLSGSLVPLIFWPSQFGIVKYLPFALIVNAPIEVLLGTQDIIKIAGIQSLWIGIFIVINGCFSEKILSRQQHIGG